LIAILAERSYEEQVFYDIMSTQEPALPQWLLDTLTRQHEQLTALVGQQVDRVTALSERLEENDQRLAALVNQQSSYEATPPQNLTPATSTRPPRSESPVRRPKPSLSDPERYDHKDKTLYPQFSGLLRAKIRHDGLAIGSEEKQAWYMFGRLKDTAAKRIFPWIDNADKQGLLSTEGLFEQMDLAFLDPRAKEKALASLNGTKQGGLSLNDFLGQFDQLLLEAGGWGWDDVIKKGYLRAALSTKLATALVGIEEKPTYDEYCTQLRRTADQLDEVKERTSSRFRHHQRRTGQEATQQPSEPEPMDWEAAIAAAVRVAVAGAGRTETKEGRWASDDEVNRRRQEGLCLRCGKDGHFVRNCRTKKPPSGQKGKTRVAAAKPKRTHEALPQDDYGDSSNDQLSSSDESSGKE
jgi:hypothetical protein